MRSDCAYEFNLHRLQFTDEDAIVAKTCGESGECVISHLGKKERLMLFMWRLEPANRENRLYQQCCLREKRH